MHEAAIYGHLDILQYLIEKKGADLVHLTDNTFGMTPLHSACSGGAFACVKYLLSIGADPEVKDKVRHRHPLPLSARLLLSFVLSYAAVAAATAAAPAHAAYAAPLPSLSDA